MSILPGQIAFAEQLVPSDIVQGFDVSEVESIDANITIALDTLHESGTHNWISSSGLASGYIKILRDYDFDSHPCREIEIVSKQVGSTDQRTVNFCQGDDFYWHPLSVNIKNFP